MAIVKKKVPVKKATKAVVKKPAPKKSAAKKVSVKKTPVKKPVVKKAPVKKTPAKKSDVKKSILPPGIPEKMRDAALKVLDERQAEEVISFSLAGRSSVADYLIIASGRAGRQIAAIADYLQDVFIKAGARQVRIEGKAEANWVLIDAGDVIVHLFRPEVRQYYGLDAIWGKNTRQA